VAEMIAQHPPGLVFLGIRMPHISGFDILRQIPNKNFKVIFTTAYNEYAIQAIDRTISMSVPKCSSKPFLHLYIIWNQ
jgi:two-component SAPR family response regulator